MGSVTFVGADGEATRVEASPGPTVMQLATANGVSGVVAECGGSMSCATCHVYVDEAWVAKAGAPSQDEQGMLEYAEAPGPTSRLSCQIRYTDALDGLVVHVPESQ